MADECERCNRLMAALRDAEAGRNDHGPYWQTSKLVAAIRDFYDAASQNLESEAANPSHDDGKVAE